jgi:hypothetical protein
LRGMLSAARVKRVLSKFETAADIAVEGTH